ncbi:MFS transporter [Nocardioides massiliensis]|uniref:Sugar phosphate permease n=1 Tax=Nocardioides massiliensis TaxID=1325935 RepID=A0ABT9NTY2_9ACTN|nr:MFS transporter [Nocardioides massiliensis]MDP9823727.1 sugar phosphate permease [Nocardioides massiliensis]
MSPTVTQAPAIRRAPPLAWAILGLGVFAYAVAVLNRSSLGVAALEAQERLNASAAQLALFSVLQLGVYAVMQVPVGVLLDRHGPRVLISCGLLLMALGQGLLAVADSVPVGVVARMLVGAGDAMTFISVIRAAVNWFPPSHLPLVTQATAIVGQCGQLAATYPLITLLAGFGWTTTFLSAAAVTLLVFVLAALLLRDAPADSDHRLHRTGLGETRTSLLLAWRQPGTRLGFWCHFTVQFSGMLFVLIWGYPFLVEGQGLSPGRAGALLASMVPAGILMGFALGRLSALHPQRRMHLVVACLVATVATWTAVIAWPGTAPGWLLGLLALALASNVPASMVGIDIARSHNPRERLGIATGMTNSGGFFAALVAILLIGATLDLVSGSGGYGTSEFRVAMATQFIVWILGSLLLLRAHRHLRDV